MAPWHMMVTTSRVRMAAAEIASVMRAPARNIHGTTVWKHLCAVPARGAMANAAASMPSTIKQLNSHADAHPTAIATAPVGDVSTANAKRAEHAAIATPPVGPMATPDTKRGPSAHAGTPRANAHQPPNTAVRRDITARHQTVPPDAPVAAPTAAFTAPPPPAVRRAQIAISKPAPHFPIPVAAAAGTGAVTGAIDGAFSSWIFYVTTDINGT